MALARPLPPLWQTLWPALHAPVRPALRLPFLQRLAQPWGALATPFGALAIPALPALPPLADIWNGILNAVPKKKTSYRKKRQRFMAGKALKDITSLNRCSGCGRVKRMHVLCPYCVDAIKTHIFGQLQWSVRRPTRKQAKQLVRERRLHRRDGRSNEEDPRKEKEEAIMKHTGWGK